METKEKLFKLISGISDENTLKAYCDLLSLLQSEATSQRYNMLTSDQKLELEAAYQESFESQHLTKQAEVKATHSKWL